MSCDVNPISSNRVGSALNGSTYDTTAAFEDVADAAYEAAYIMNAHQPPSAGAVMNYMKALNNLNAYLTKNPPTSDSVVGAQLLKDLNTSLFPGSTLAQACAVPLLQANVDFIKGNSQSSVISGFLSDAYNADNSTIDNGSVTTQNDIWNIQQYLAAYNTAVNRTPPDPQAVNTAMDNFANAIAQFSKDTPAGGFDDGFLTVLTSQLATPCDTVGGTSLLAICQALVASPSDPTALANMQAALQNMGENASGGGDLSALFSKSYSEEPWTH